MSTQTTQQEWGLLYYRKKAQFNEYVEFKTKSFQYQKLLSKLHFLSNDDEQTQKKHLRQFIKSLNDTMQEMRNIFSQIQQEMKFLKLQQLASLVENLQQLLTSVHHYTIEDFKNKVEYKQKNHDNQGNIDMATCKKCHGSINQLNLKRLYDEITTTQSSVEDQKQKMTKQGRRKMISQLDEYDILLAEKQNYLRKVNQVLQSKGKVGQLSNHDKTYNFLSQYLSKIQKIQERRNKSYNKSDPTAQAQDRKWQEESYKHILEYIKRVLFEHFVNQCSGPVKKMFQKINIDKLFKSFNDHENEENDWKSPTIMQNHQTQTVSIPQVEQLKLVERKMQFKVKEVALLKSNKDELQRKYLSTLDLNRKIESDMFEVKKQKKWYQSEMKLAQQSLKNLTQKYQQTVKQYEEDQRSIIERCINQRQRILNASKIMENDYIALNQEHKKCLKMRNVPKEFVNVQTQVYLEEFPDELQEQTMMQRNESSPLKRRRSKMNRMMFTSINENRKNGMFLKDEDKMATMFEAYRSDTISEKDQQQSKAETRLQIQPMVVDLFIDPQNQNGNIEFGSKLKQQKSFTKIIKEKPQLRQNEQKWMKRMLTEGDESTNFGNGKRIKISMKSFKKSKKDQQLRQAYNIDAQKKQSPYKFSKFSNRYTEGDELFKSNFEHNLTSPDLYSKIHKKQNQTKQYNDVGYMVSDRLYSQRKRKESKELPFERVIENGKEKFYIKKISRQSINYKLQKQKMKEISQILKPYVYNNSNAAKSQPKRTEQKKNFKTIREKLSFLEQRRFSTDGKDNNCQQQHSPQNQQKVQEKTVQVPSQPAKHIGHDILSVQQIIQSQYAYLKAVGFIDFLMKIGKQNKKMVKTINKIQHQVKEKFKSPTQADLQLFGGRSQAEDYIKGKNFWILDDAKENMMIYNRNDGLSIKVQKYFTLLKRANPELYGVLIRFLVDPVFAVFGKKTPNQQNRLHRPDDNNLIRDLFNQLQKYHKIKHNQCSHIIDFLEKIGFYKYTYF